VNDRSGRVCRYKVFGDHFQIIQIFKSPVNWCGFSGLVHVQGFGASGLIY